MELENKWMGNKASAAAYAAACTQINLVAYAGMLRSCAFRMAYGPYAAYAHRCPGTLRQEEPHDFLASLTLAFGRWKRCLRPSHEGRNDLHFPYAGPYASLRRARKDKQVACWDIRNKASRRACADRHVAYARLPSISSGLTSSLQTHVITAKMAFCKAARYIARSSAGGPCPGATGLRRCLRVAYAGGLRMLLTPKPLCKCSSIRARRLVRSAAENTNQRCE
jgi:hypothetical protein